MKKIVSLLLVVALVAACFVGCAKNVTIDCTCDCNKAGATAKAGAEYQKLTANGKSGVDCSKMPSDAASVLKLYTEVANATKAVQNQKFDCIDSGAQISINQVTVGDSGKPLSDAFMGTIKNLVKEFAPAEKTTNYEFTNGKGKDAEGKDKALVDAMPVTGAKEACTLADADVAEATCKELDDGYWQIDIKLNATQVKFTDPKKNPEAVPAKCSSCMKSSDLLTSFGGAAEIKGADLDYNNCSLMAVIDPASGYLVQLVTCNDFDAVIKGELAVAGALQGDAHINSTITYNWISIG